MWSPSAILRFRIAEGRYGCAYMRKSLWLQVFG